MKRAEQIIDIARKLSGNTRYDSDSGVPQSLFVQYLNNAQDSLLMEVTNSKSKYLLKQAWVDVVSGQETYDYPTDCLIEHIDTIQWLDSRTGSYFQTLLKTYPNEKVSTQVGYAFGYSLQNDGYHLNPPLTNGVLQLSYIKTLPKIQKRAGQITVATVNGSNQLTALTVATTGSYDESEINDDYFLCVVDKFGVQKAVNIEYTSVSAGVFALSAHQLTTGETVSVGDYICVGKNCTNLPLWPDLCESYLIKHMVYDAKYSDSSSWSKEAKQDMIDRFIQLSSIFSLMSDDLTQINISSVDYLGY